MLSWAPLIESVFVPLVVSLISACVFLLLWLARDRPGAIKGHPKQFFSGSRHSLTVRQKVLATICFQVCFMAILFLFAVDFDRSSMHVFVAVLLYTIWFLVVMGAIAATIISFFLKHDLLLFFLVFGVISGMTASVLGLMMYETYVSIARHSAEGKHFTGTSPIADASGFRDAGTIEFSPKAFVDEKRARGYLDGSIYCVAPVAVSTTSTTPVQFWAVGTDCCHSRFSFKCGAHKKDLNAPLFGSVVPEPLVPRSADWPWLSEYEQYYRAVKMASAEFSTNLRPILVRLEEPPDPTLTQYAMTCGDKNLAMVHKGSKGSVEAHLTMATQGFKRFMPVQGEGEWYNILISYSDHVWYLSASKAGNLYFRASDLGNGHQRWTISPNGTIKLLAQTNKGQYLACGTSMAEEENKGVWTFPDWNFGNSTNAGWGSLAFFFFGCGTSIVWFIIFSVVYLLVVQIVLSIVPSPMSETDKDNE